MERSLAERATADAGFYGPGRRRQARYCFDYLPTARKLLAGRRMICCNTALEHSPTYHVLQGGLIMTRTVTPPAAQPSSQPKITHERIAMLAYEKWLQRGCPHGNDQQDWLEAEAELKGTSQRTETASAARTTPPA